MSRYGDASMAELRFEGEEEVGGIFLLEAFGDQGAVGEFGGLGVHFLEGGQEDVGDQVVAGPLVVGGDDVPGAQVVLVAESIFS